MVVLIPKKRPQETRKHANQHLQTAGGGVQQNAVGPAAYKPMILRCRPAVQTYLNTITGPTWNTAGAQYI
jgi:hypothetical protein